MNITATDRRALDYPARVQNESFGRVFEVVKMIPEGRVATYGDVAALAGRPGAPRWAGQALANLTGDDVPWHRVLNAQGRVSLDGVRGRVQRQRLMAEGVSFSSAGRVDLIRYRWRPRVRVRR